MRKFTIKDVAKIANVSEATVSRVMSNSSLISDKTKEKVMEVVRKLDYFPNSAAVSLTKSKSNILGLVIVSSDKKEKVKGDFIFTGSGYGHGVGLSQSGARGMAEAGYGYKKIIMHYFTGVEVH